MSTRDGAIYNEIEPYAADWLEGLITAGHIEPGTVDRRSIEDLTPDDVQALEAVGDLTEDRPGSNHGPCR